MEGRDRSIHPSYQNDIYKEKKMAGLPWILS
jgi:hypothetical protein